jgi:hypothetical protein
MPRFPLLACGLEIGVLLVGAVFALVHDTGIWRLLSPMIHVLGIVLVVAFLFRAKYSMLALEIYAKVGVALGLLQLSARALSSADPVVTEATPELIALLLLAFALSSQKTRDWFQNKNGDRTCAQVKTQT